MSNFTTQENIRYARQTILPEIGPHGQQKLKDSRILVIGAGGLGVPVLQYLAAAGVGTIGIADGDVVELSNLQRQVLYDESDIGYNKAEAAGKKLSKLNSGIKIISYPEHITSENAEKIFSGYEIIADCSDNFPARYLINDVCIRQDKPFVSGAVFKFTGQAGVFNYNGSGSYRCLFPEPPAAEDRPDCNEIGVLGIVPGTTGLLMANEIIKVICGIGEVLAGKIVTVDFLSMKFQPFSFLRDEEAIEKIKTSPLYSLAEYEMFCGRQASSEVVKEISAIELKKLLAEDSNIQLIDVREAAEHEEENIGGELIPFDDVLMQTEKISNDRQVIFYCKSGMRSRIIIQRLQENSGMKNLYSLKGGIREYLHPVKQPVTF